MPDNLAQTLLDQGPACQWIVRRQRGRREILFEQVWGDPSTLFGRPAATLSGANCLETLPAEIAQAWCGRFERAFDGETLALRDRRGKTIWHISVFPIRIPGKCCYSGGIAREMTAFSSAEQELRRTVLGALKAQEFDRAMMARFLHDSIGQNLTALGLQLDLIRMDVEATIPEVAARVAEVQKVLGEMMEGVREYSYELNPSAVERAGLRSALDRLVFRVRERFAGIFRVNVDPSANVEPKLASALYQIAQEAVENALHHAGCSSIDISLRVSRTGTILEVRDNGRGFDPDDILGGHRGLGLLSMEHYAAQAGLELSIVSTREMGTTVRATTT